MKLIIAFVLCVHGVISVAGTPVSVAENVEIGGIRQHIRIQGADDTLPLLLFLHGGPGGSVMSYAQRFTDRLQKHFLVVQWDQRETGKTLELNASPEPLTVDLFERDTHELIRLLLTRFNREKLFLAGHSWGTALGFRMVQKHPGLLYAFIAIGPMVRQLESERIALTTMLEDAVKRGHRREIEELQKVSLPFGSGEQLYYHRKWLLAHAGARKTLSRQYVEDWSARWLSVFNDASKDNLPESLPSVSCPVYFFAGRRDLQTNSLLAEKYYIQLAAPAKGFFWFEHSAHGIPSSEPARLQQIIIEQILPQTFSVGVTVGSQ